MIDRITDISQRKAAIVAGLALLVMTILAIFANFFVFSSLVVPGDAATTANNIMTHESLFRAGICSFIIVAALDVVAAWALFVFLKQANNSLSSLAAWFRLAYAAIFGIALANIFSVLLLLSGTDYLTAFETNQLHAQVMLSLNSFNNGWSIGLVFFGLHLIFVGWLVFKLGFPGYITRILGILLIIAGLGYLIDSLGKILIPNYNANIAMFTFIGELLLMLWLLFKGAKIPEMKS